MAPSVHNTQPWRMALSPGGISLYADRTRQLSVLDPAARQLTISCGCAILNARVSLAAAGFGSAVERFPSPSDPDLMAVITPIDGGSVDPNLAALDEAIEKRHTNRRRFEDVAVDPDDLDAITVAVAAEGAQLANIHSVDQRLTVVRLTQRADEIENLNPSYRAEIRAWTTDDPGRVDGVPNSVIPSGSGPAHDDVPIRHFDEHLSGKLPPETHSSRYQSLTLLCTDTDHPADWLRAGEALERALLEITRRGYVASPLTQVTEVPSTRNDLRAELGLKGFPHVLLRIGRAPATPATRRRRLVDVLEEDV
jgi:hypothetical protein